MAYLPAAKAALTLAPLALGLFHKKKKGRNANEILARYKASRPTGYTTPEDEAAAERTRTRIAGASANAAQRARQMNARQVTARGLGGAAAAALDTNAQLIEGAGAEEAARNSADQLYQAYNSNLNYNRQQNNTAFNAEMGLAAQERAQSQAQEGTFWNSMFEAIPAVAGAFAGGPAGGATRSYGTYNPSGAEGTPTPNAGVPMTPAQQAVRSGRSGAIYR